MCGFCFCDRILTVAQAGFKLETLLSLVIVGIAGIYYHTCLLPIPHPPKKKDSFYEVVVSIFCNQCNELEYLMYLSVLFGNK